MNIRKLKNNDSITIRQLKEFVKDLPEMGADNKEFEVLIEGDMTLADVSVLKRHKNNDLVLKIK